MSDGPVRRSRLPSRLLRIAVSGCIVNGGSLVALAAGPSPVMAEHGMVVSASDAASQAGVEILRRGGNAVDAAAAAGFVLAVTYPQAGNIGGGGFMVARMADGTVFALDFRETAPAKAHRDLFLDGDGNVAVGLSLYSPLASGVPGSVDGLLRAWRDHGSARIALGDLLEEAVRLARNGFPLSRGMARSLNAARKRFEADTGASKIFIRPDGKAWEAGDLFVQRDLARTLRRIARDGRDGFYAGATARMLANQMSSTGGLITREDLANYESKYREPVRGEFQGYEIVTMPPPSSGVLVIYMLHMLEAYPLADLGWNSSAYVHLLTETQRRVYADRAEHLGDPDFWKVPLETLLSKDYARQRAAGISMHRATPSRDVKAGDPAAFDSEETTHYSIVDQWGNAVAVTTTLNGSFGSGIVVDGAGFLLNNEMDDFSAKPGAPNLYGLVGNEANAIAPGKRMLSSMSPTIVFKDEKPFLVVGTPGGSTIITTVLQIILNVTVHGMDVQEAVSAPRFHSQWLPDEIRYERFAFSRDVESALRALGHTLAPPERAIGQANCILIGEDGLYGAPDTRGENAAVGY